jgi:hypothetical protein
MHAPSTREIALLPAACRSIRSKTPAMRSLQEDVVYPPEEAR